MIQRDITRYYWWNSLSCYKFGISKFKWPGLFQMWGKQSNWNCEITIKKIKFWNSSNQTFQIVWFRTWDYPNTLYLNSKWRFKLVKLEFKWFKYLEPILKSLVHTHISGNTYTWSHTLYMDRTQNGSLRKFKLFKLPFSVWSICNGSNENFHHMYFKNQKKLDKDDNI
jgi:hypothetical protein